MAQAATENRASLQTLRDNLCGVIRGKDEAVDLLIVALLANGSVLMEDVPGVGKTTLARALSKSIEATFHRIQFTPDLLPADILGGSIYNPVDGSFSFRPGPIFCNVLLADEINRASPRTQSALLEAMSEMQATIEGETHPLPAPFLVLATQNPVEYHGTYPLPEAQLDRFLVRLTLGYPDPETEVEIVAAHREEHPLEKTEPVIPMEEVVRLQGAVRGVRVEAPVARYIVSLVEATRHDERVQLGASPRGSLMLYRAAQAEAYRSGRDYVLPDDAQKLAVSVLAHRMMLNAKARYGGVTKQEIIHDIVSRTRVPT